VALAVDEPDVLLLVVSPPEPDPLPLLFSSLPHATSAAALNPASKIKNE
jgi:hypothetical protein